MKKVLVTGLNGFTGAYIKDALESSGYLVVGLAITNTEKVTSDDIVCDITDYNSLERALEKIQLHGVIHLAALSFVGHKNPLDFYRVNTLGTQNLLDAVHKTQKGVNKVVLASSANVYGSVGGNDPIAETASFAPVSHYAISKVAMEYVAQTFFDKLPIVITRPFNYTGVGQRNDFLVPKIVGHYQRGEKEIELGNIDIARDFTDVRDVARAYLGLYESNIESRAINICSGKAYSIQDILSFMNEIAGLSLKVVVNKNFVRENEIKILIGDNHNLRTLTGFENKYPIERTLKDMFLSCG